MCNCNCRVIGISDAEGKRPTKSRNGQLEGDQLFAYHIKCLKSCKGRAEPAIFTAWGKTPNEARKSNLARQRCKTLRDSLKAKLKSKKMKPGPKKDKFDSKHNLGMAGVYRKLNRM